MGGANCADEAWKEPKCPQEAEKPKEQKPTGCGDRGSSERKGTDETDFATNKEDPRPENLPTYWVVYGKKISPGQIRQNKIGEGNEPAPDAKGGTEALGKTK